MKYLGIAFVSLLTSIGSTSSVSAQSATQSHTVSIAITPVDGIGYAIMPAFDPAMGVLRSVELRIVASVSGTLSLENTTTGVASNGISYFGARFHPPMPFLAYAPIATAYFESAAHVPAPLDMAPFDGVLDFQGPSSTTYIFAGQATYGSPDRTYGPITNGQIAQFIGPVGAPGTTEILVYADNSNNFFLSPGVLKSTTLIANAQVTLKYAYDPLPTAFCLPALTYCPCFPTPQSPDRGCSNSVTSGATLALNGSASISADTLGLQAAFMPDGPALFFQGSSYQFVPGTLGDGLMCISGNITRLGVKFNTAGASSYPTAGDASLSVQGAVVSPTERYYQVYYRDSANHCTAGTMNLSNGMAVRWQP